MAITASIIGSTFVTVMLNGVTHTISSDHTNYDAIRAALRDKNYDEVENLINVRAAVETFVQGKVTVEADRVLYGSLEVRGSVVRRILDMRREGFDAAPMINFLENLMQNPSKRAVDELYGFLEATQLPITEDGCFLAYKKVGEDYKDLYTGQMDNSIGKVVEMPRNGVDEDKDRTCSAGLHFCSLSYLPHYRGGAGRVLIVKINPKDVVAIPSDYNNAKGRTCRYEVIGETEAEDRETNDYFTAPVYNNMTPATPMQNRNQGNPSLEGYNQGRSDAANGREFDEHNDYDMANGDYDRYCNSYLKGWNSIKDAAGTDATESDYTRGYNQGRDDSNNGAEYADTFDESDDYQNGYEAGWIEANEW
jgi:hypothetical protein